MLIGCSIHKTRDSKRYATVYSRWSEDAERWCRFKQKYCVSAFIDLMGLWRTGVDSPQTEIFECSLCGTECSRSGSETYLTIFKPKSEQQDIALLTCESCTPRLRNYLRDGAEIPADRGGVGAQSPNNTPDEWETLP